jgi:poly[(R)-3-hydroxyalkanoate] polymerase subunit PhaC
MLGWPHVVDLMLGVSGAPVASTPCDKVWESGPATLWRYRGARRHAEPVLLVHALVTKPWILDLTPSRSLVGSLVDEGFDVWLLDWPDAPSAADGLSAYAQALMAAEAEVLRICRASRLHLAGYCSGGTLVLARAAARLDPSLASIAAIAAPVDFGVPGGMRTLLASRWLKPALALDASSCVPPAVVRESFHALRPSALRTVWRRMRLPSSAEAEDAYASLARWAWEQRPIPGRLFFDLVDLYRTNALIEGDLRLDGRRADLKNIDVPVLLTLAARDHIVPGASSLALTTVGGISVEVITAPSGHVSMISGTSAKTVLIPALVAWLQKHQAPAPTPNGARHRGTTKRTRRPASGVTRSAL